MTLQCLNGNDLPRLGLGTWKMPPALAASVVRIAIEMGYRHIDCAWIYENESGVGSAIQTAIAEGIVSREALWITSKLWNNRHDPAEVEPAVIESIQALGVDQLDLYLMHWPVALRAHVVRPASGSDFLSLDAMPLERTWEAMQRLVERGLVRSIGVSNFNEKKLERLIQKTGITPSMNQVESHCYLQQRDLLNFCKVHQIEFTAYSPLGSGDRPDGMRRADEPVLLTDETIAGIASELNCQPGQVLLAWALERGTLPIPKASTEEHLRDNLDSLKINLTSKHMARIENLERAYRYVDGVFWEMSGGPYTVDYIWNH